MPGMMRLTAAARRRVIEPALSALRDGTLLAEWEELERTQRLALADLHARQAEKLRQLVASVCAKSPFYRRRFDAAGIEPGDVRGADDLARLPILTKHEVRRSAGELLCPRPGRLMESRTGGSTGVPLVLHFTEAVSERRNAAARRSNRWTGWEVGEPVAAVWGNPHLPSSARERLRHHLLNPVIYLDTMQLRAETVGRFARDWRRVHPTLLFGHAHSIYALAREVRALGIDDVRPKAVLSTSMMLLAPERAVIEEVFGVPVFDRYGCEEVGLIGAECERHDGMHVNVDHLVVEFLRDDGSRARPGELAHVVVTDLLNEAMPLIRYDVGDMAAERPGACPCGRGLPMMERVAGRVADFLKRTDGTRVAGVSLIENSLTKFPGIGQMQIVQDSLDTMRLRVVPDEGFDEAARALLADYFRETFPGADVHIELAGEIRREANGKYRFAICNVPD